MQNYIYMQKYVGKYMKIYAKHYVCFLWDSLVEVKLWSAEEGASMGQFSSYVGGQKRV